MTMEWSHSTRNLRGKWRYNETDPPGTRRGNDDGTKPHHLEITGEVTLNWRIPAARNLMENLLDFSSLWLDTSNQPNLRLKLLTCIDEESPWSRVLGEGNHVTTTKTAKQSIDQDLHSSTNYRVQWCKQAFTFPCTRKDFKLPIRFFNLIRARRPTAAVSLVTQWPLHRVAVRLTVTVLPCPGRMTGCWAATGCSS